jgi:anti-sigma regulatory factor (Ser/Thr protein kinase)
MTSRLAHSETLEPDLAAPRTARQYARLTCAGVASQVRADEVTLVVSELVTNALRHGRGQISLVLRVTPGAVFVAVGDRGPSFDSALVLGVHGRGLTIVAEIVSSWGVHSLGDGGKLVWCVIREPARQTSAGREDPGIAFLLGLAGRMREPLLGGLQRPAIDEGLGRVPLACAEPSAGLEPPTRLAHQPFPRNTASGINGLADIIGEAVPSFRPMHSRGPAGCDTTPRSPASLPGRLLAALGSGFRRVRSPLRALGLMTGGSR